MATLPAVRILPTPEPDPPTLDLAAFVAPLTPARAELYISELDIRIAKLWAEERTTLSQAIRQRLETERVELGTLRPRAPFHRRRALEYWASITVHPWRCAPGAATAPAHESRRPRLRASRLPEPQAPPTHQLGLTAARCSSRAATTRSNVCTRIVRLASRANASLLNPACARTISASATAARSVARVMASRTAW